MWGRCYPPFDRPMQLHDGHDSRSSLRGPQATYKPRSLEKLCNQDCVFHLISERRANYSCKLTILLSRTLAPGKNSVNMVGYI